eukprot:TRINITY_DN8957_c0_g1_i1.p1 TRINITY_DN8957_c0_g1~~TRINITY_DN8957_c0_g1_i1.p1  ORF type:complete len:614 (-),score=113.51 TRINITY_DN8957_c0_g1_i1:100-1941(-)
MKFYRIRFRSRSSSTLLSRRSSYFHHPSSSFPSSSKRSFSQSSSSSFSTSSSSSSSSSTIPPSPPPPPPPRVGRSFLRNAGRVSGFVLGAGIVGLGLAYIAQPEDERAFMSSKISRYYTFWRTLLPIVVDYKWTEYRTKDMPEDVQQQRFDALHDRYAPQILALILNLKGLYIKVGQVAAMRPDMLPKQYRDSLSILWDNVPSRSADEMRTIICRSLKIDRIEDMFLEFNEKPIGAASVGQVHEAKLLDGTEVVIKVQYPDAKMIFDLDLTTSRQFAALVRPEQLPMFDEIEKQLMMELDFEREGWALKQVYENIMPIYNEKVIIPRPIPGLATKNVLVMEKLQGGIKLVDGIMNQYKAIAEANGMTMEQLKERAMTEFKKAKSKQSRFMRPPAWALRLYIQYLRIRNATGNMIISLYNHSIGFVAPSTRFGYFSTVKPPLNHAFLMDTLLQVHGHQIFVDGVFNADPHPGNIFLMPDGRIGLLDYGQVKVLDMESRKQLARLVVALAEGTKDDIVREMVSCGMRTRHMDPFVIEKIAVAYYDHEGPDVSGDKNVHEFVRELQERDPILDYPKDIFLVARTAMILRGTGMMLAYSVSTAKAWLPFAKQILATN